MSVFGDVSIGPWLEASREARIVELFHQHASHASDADISELIQEFAAAGCPITRQEARCQHAMRMLDISVRYLEKK